MSPVGTENTHHGTAGAPAQLHDGGWRARDRRTNVSLTLLAALLFFVYLIPDIFYRVFPGEAAAYWWMFAGGTDIEMRDEGLRVKWPWDRVYIYDIRMQQETRTFDALSNDGLPIEVEVSIRFRLHRHALGMLHKHVGPDYVETLVIPELGAHVREEIARFRPDELYGHQRELIQTTILEQVGLEMRLDYELEEDVPPQQEMLVYVEDVLIRNLELPPQVAAAIESKLTQEQRMLEYDYRLEKEDKERQRKAIEAEGIRAFQDIVTGGISEPYLRWKGIDATLALASSTNSKIVVIGAGEDGLPLILGGFDRMPESSGTGTEAAAGAPTAGSAPTAVPPPDLP